MKLIIQLIQTMIFIRMRGEMTRATGMIVVQLQAATKANGLEVLQEQISQIGLEEIE
jgi:hypothetical protein